MDVCALKCVNVCKCVSMNVWVCMRVVCEFVCERVNAYMCEQSMCVV